MHYALKKELIEVSTPMVEVVVFVPHFNFPAWNAFCNIAFHFLLGSGFGIPAPTHKFAVDFAVEGYFFAESAAGKSSTAFAEDKVCNSQFAATLKVGELFGSAYGLTKIASE